MSFPFYQKLLLLILDSVVYFCITWVICNFFSENYRLDGLNIAVGYIVIHLCLYLYDLYKLNSLSLRVSSALKAFLAFGSSALLFYLLDILFFLFVGKDLIFEKKLLLSTLIIFCCWIITFRVQFIKSLMRASNKLNWLIVASADNLDRLQRDLLESFPYYNIKLVSDKYCDLEGIIGSCEDLPGLLSREWYGVAVENNFSLNEDIEKSLLEKKVHGTRFYELSTFYEKIFHKVPVLLVKDSWFLFGGSFEILHSSFHLKLKRMLDIFLAVTLLILSFPIVLIAIIFIKFSDGGPVFFSQKRIGAHGGAFTLYKLRTMKVNSETNGAAWASKNDPRIILFGNTLRKYRIDELPQLLNVIRGEMSFVGPRPEQEYFVEQLRTEIPYYDLRHLVKPGLTGWAQVSYPYGASVNDAIEKLQYDLFYIKHCNIILDAFITLKTIRTVLGRSGR